MKLNLAERLLVNNDVRAVVQRLYEGPLLRRLGGTVSGGQALEVGCGQGIGVQVILEQLEAAHVWGVDLDARQIARAQNRLGRRFDGRFTLQQGDVERLPFASSSFDAVFDFGVLHHAPDWRRGLVEIRRVLRPGGVFFFEEVTRAALERWIYRKLFVHPAEGRFEQSEFLEELRRHGLEPADPVHRVLFGDIFIGVARMAGSPE